MSLTKERKWFLYLLYHPQARRTYVGITTDVHRRLRQHCGEIVGGARFTTRIQKKFPQESWTLVAVLAFSTSQAEVTRWERLLKISSRGLTARLKAMEALACGEQPEGFNPRQRENYPVPKGLVLEKYV